MEPTKHEPVLLNEVLNHFAAVESNAHERGRATPILLDATLGGAGHTAALLRQHPQAFLVAFDQDAQAVERAKAALSDVASRIHIVCANFARIAELAGSIASELRSRSVLSADEPLQFDGVLADLGISSDQLDDPKRGFSFLADSPLDMRINPDAPLTAAEVLNTYSRERLLRMFQNVDLGPLARALADEIVAARPFSTTSQFARACEHVLGSRSGWKRSAGRPAKNPATLPFLALRIEVNDEFGVVRTFLDNGFNYLAPGGVLAVISFHSLEDEIVAKTLRRWARPAPGARRIPVPGPQPVAGDLLTPKPVIPAENEIQTNPRSRSARMRVFRRSVERTELMQTPMQ